MTRDLRTTCLQAMKVIHLLIIAIIIVVIIINHLQVLDDMMVYETIVNEGFTLNLRPTDVVSMVQSVVSYFSIFANNVDITMRADIGYIDSSKAYIDQDKVILLPSMNLSIL